MDGFIGFMNAPLGRGLRVILGLVMIAIGLLGLGGVWGTALAIIGLVPIAMGAWGRCLIEPLAHGGRTA
jgi:hypothetical protein